MNPSATAPATPDPTASEERDALDDMVYEDYLDLLTEPGTYGGTP